MKTQDELTAIMANRKHKAESHEIYYNQNDVFEMLNEVNNSARQFNSNEVDLEGLYNQFKQTFHYEFDFNEKDWKDCFNFFLPYLKTPEPKESDAVEFAKYISTSYTLMESNDKYFHNNWDGYIDNLIIYTTERLYQQFLNSK